MEFPGTVEVQNWIEWPWMTIEEKPVKKRNAILSIRNNLTHSLSIKEYWEQTFMIWLWVTAEASFPRRESGTLSRTFQSTSCLTPPTLRLTLLFSLRPFKIRKLLEEISEGFLSWGECRPSLSFLNGKSILFMAAIFVLRQSFQQANFLSLLSSA